MGATLAEVESERDFLLEVVAQLTVRLGGEQTPIDTVAICGCGFPLIPVYGVNDERIGVSHVNGEQEHHHSKYFGGMLVEQPEQEVD